MKLQVACNYAVIRFLPYPEAGEFVNVGVVLHCPATGFFDFRLLDARRTSRVNAFFPELKKEYYRDALNHCAEELSRMRGEVRIAGETAQQMTLNPAVGMALFRELIRPRETVIRFSSAGTVMAHEPTFLLQELYERYVLRMFAKETEYQEEVMRHRVSETLREHRLITRFREAPVGNVNYHVTFPFVDQPRIGKFARAIKPLNLAQSDSTKIYDHGSVWLMKIDRLRKIRKAPERMLFPIHRPPKSEKRQSAACEEICRELTKREVIVVPEDDEAALIEFASVG